MSDRPEHDPSFYFGYERPDAVGPTAYASETRTYHLDGGMMYHAVREEELVVRRSGEADFQYAPVQQSGTGMERVGRDLGWSDESTQWDPRSPTCNIEVFYRWVANMSDERTTALAQAWTRASELLGQTSVNLRRTAETLAANWQSPAATAFLEQVGAALTSLDDWRYATQDNASGLRAIAEQIMLSQINLSRSYRNYIARAEVLANWLCDYEGLWDRPPEYPIREQELTSIRRAASDLAQEEFHPEAKGYTKAIADVYTEVQFTRLGQGRRYEAQILPLDIAGMRMQDAMRHVFEEMQRRNAAMMANLYGPSAFVAPEPAALPPPQFVAPTPPVATTGAPPSVPVPALANPTTVGPGNGNFATGGWVGVAGMELAGAIVPPVAPALPPPPPAPPTLVGPPAAPPPGLLPAFPALPPVPGRTVGGPPPPRGAGPALPGATAPPGPPPPPSIPGAPRSASGRGAATAPPARPAGPALPGATAPPGVPPPPGVPGAQPGRPTTGGAGPATPRLPGATTPTAGARPGGTPRAVPPPPALPGLSVADKSVRPAGRPPRAGAVGRGVGPVGPALPGSTAAGRTQPPGPAPALDPRAGARRKAKRGERSRPADVLHVPGQVDDSLWTVEKPTRPLKAESPPSVPPPPSAPSPPSSPSPPEPSPA